MRLVPIFLITAALADDEKRDWFRIRRTPGVRRAKGERMRGVSMTKGLNPPSKHGWPVDHPTMPRRDDHPGRPLKSRAAHVRRKRDETRDWLRIRRTPGVRRAKGERMRGVSMTKGLNPPSKHGWPVDHPTMPRRDDHPGRPLKSRAAHVRRKRDEARDKHREKTRRAKAHRDEVR